MEPETTAKLSRARVRRDEMGPSDDAALIWFFGPGVASFERSTFGDQIARASLLSSGSIPCGGCVAGVVVPEADAFAKELEAARQEREANRFTGVAPTVSPGTCKFCKGTGVIPSRLPKQDLSLLTAQPIQTGHSEQGYTPDAGLLEKYARVSKRLHAMSPRSVAVLAAYFGEDGMHWALTDLGQLWAVYPLTAAGRELLGFTGSAKRKTKKPKPGKRSKAPRPEPERAVLSPLERLAALRRGSTQTPEVRAAFSAAEHEAKRLLAVAQTGWMRTIGGAS